MRKAPRAIRLCAGCAFALLTWAAAPAYADDASPSGSATLSLARTAWGHRDFSKAEQLYRTAVERGGLSSEETLDAYVHLGTARSLLGRKSSALDAFREAARIDDAFAVPKEAGRKATQLAQAARDDVRKHGKFTIASIQAPSDAPAGKPLRVTADLNASKEIVKVGLEAHDPHGMTIFRASTEAARHVVFEVPGESTRGATNAIVLRATAYDTHDNALTHRETSVNLFVPAPAPAAIATHELPPAARDRDRDQATSTSHGGIWSSPWTYFLGGVALAAAGTALYFGTRTSDDVSIGSARLTAH